MDEPYTNHLPKLKVILHCGKRLKPNSYVKISVGTLQSERVKSSTVKKTHDPDWNEEFIIRIENGPDPFRCLVEVFSAKAIGSASYIGCFEVDLYKDLGLHFEGDKRKYSFPLNTQGELTMTFCALSDLNFPIMKTNNVDGNPITSSLPFKPNPELEITVYQAIRLQGPKKLSSYVQVQLKTFDFQALPGAKPDKLKSILKTKVFKGHSPYWGEKCRTFLYTNRDAIKIGLIYYKDKAHKEEESICTIGIEELSKIATSTETRRWYAFTQRFKGTAIGIGFRALSDTKAIESLPDPPGVLSEEEWNEQHKNARLPSFVESEPSIKNIEEAKSEHLAELLESVQSFYGMESDKTESYLTNEIPAAEKQEEFEKLQSVDDVLKEQLVRFGLEVSRQQLEGEREKNKKEMQALREEKAKLLDDRAKLLEGGFGTLGGKKQFQDTISSIISNIDKTSDIAHGKRRSSSDFIARTESQFRLELLKKQSSIDEDEEYNIEDILLEAKLRVQKVMMSDILVISESVAETIEKIACNLCKGLFLKNKVFPLRGKLFCRSCRVRLQNK